MAGTAHPPTGKRAVVALHAPHVCGVARHCLELLRFLRESGFSTTVVFTMGGGRWAQRFHSASDQVIVLYNSAPLPGFNWQGVELVSAHFGPAIDWALSQTPPNIPLFAHLHTAPEFDETGRRLLPAAADRCRKVFFSSEATLRQYVELGDALPPRAEASMAVLPNAAPENLVPRGKINRCRRSGAANMRVAVISRLDADKFSPPLFFQAVEALLERGSRPEVRVAGWGELAESVVSEAVRRRLTDAIAFLGFVDDLDSLYSWSDVVFLPSVSEAMPYVALESLAAATPVVLPRVGHFGESAEQAGVFTFASEDHGEAARLLREASRMEVPPQGWLTDASRPGAWRISLSMAFNLSCGPETGMAR